MVSRQLVSDPFSSIVSMSLCFPDFFLFLCYWISFVCFPYDRSICTHLLDPLFLTIHAGEFQVWDRLFYPLACGHRGKLWVRMKQTLYPNFYPGRDLNLGNLAWQSNTQPQHQIALLKLNRHGGLYQGRFL